MSRGERLPDIMEVISDLSNDEVRTPPKVANQVLDLLPAEVWENPSYRWLDPGAKSGVFLREATKRLMSGLVHQIPDEEERLTHILTKQMFGIGITQLSAMMSRRALYCSKDASGPESVVRMPTSNGNVWQERVSHPFKNGRCTECRAGQDQFGKLLGENHAYGFIHENGRNAITKEWDMKFDVIVGNPPYQMAADEAGQNFSPLYDEFVTTAISLSPEYITMIIPSRWMAGGRGLDNFRDRLLSDTRIRRIQDYPDASEIFPNVSIKGGVCFFLWQKKGSGKCEFISVRSGSIQGPHDRDLAEFDVLIRDNRALPVVRRVLEMSSKDLSLANLVSTRDPFGPNLSSSMRDYRESPSGRTGELRCHLIEGGKRKIVWVDSSRVTRNKDVIGSWKVFLPKAYGAGEAVPHQIIGVPIIGEPGDVSTISYIFAGPLRSKEESDSFVSYLRTRFVRFLVSQRKISQNITSSVYSWVPTQTWDRLWTDDELYEKYQITKDEQDYIESMVKEMPAT